jgi:hypothetical protein
MSWLRLSSDYVRELLRAIPWRVHVQRVRQLKGGAYSIGSPDFGAPSLKVREVVKVHHLKARNFDLGEELPGDRPNTARARRALIRLMRNNPDPRTLKLEHRSKDAIWRIYRERFSTKKGAELSKRDELSRRTFNALWDFAISKTGATGYCDPGPRGRRP